MKKYLLNLYEKSQKLTFFQGVILTVSLTSLVSIASTVLPNGLFSFSPGTPISSSEVNANFEKLASVAGKTVLKVTLSPFTLTNNSYGIPSNCGTCNNFSKKIKFDSIIVSDGNLKEATDNENDPNYSNFSQGDKFHYYVVPENGWYEIRFASNLSYTYNPAIACTSPGLGYNCNFNISIYTNVWIANSLTDAVANYSPNSISLLQEGASVQKNDDDNDNILENYMAGGNMQPLMEIKRYYLKSGQVLFAWVNSNYAVNNVTDTSISANSNGIEFTINKL